MPRNTDDMKMLSFGIPAELYEKIQAAANADDRTVSNFVKRTLERAMNEPACNNAAATLAGMQWLKTK